MISNRIVASIAVAIMMSVCIAPANAADSDGSTTIRCTDGDLYEGTFEKNAGYYLYYYGGQTMYFIEGSENHEKMKQYVADPTNPKSKVEQDDMSTLRVNTWHGTVHVYTWKYGAHDGSNDVASTSDEKRISVDLKKVMDSFGKLSFFIKAGDTIKIDITATNSEGNDAKPYYIDPEYNRVFLTSYEKEFKTSYNMVIQFYEGGLYQDVTYSVSGISQPNGSATAYFVFCAIVTVLVLAILAYAALKPKWSK